MEILFGVILHFFGGVSSGSFYIPLKRVKGWSWEVYWITAGFFSWLIIPIIAVLFTVPNPIYLLQLATQNEILLTIFFGLLWGIGGMTYGLSVRYLGVSLGSSITLGLCSFFGAIIPSIYYYYYPKDGSYTISDFFVTNWGNFILFGLLTCIVGIIFCGYGGHKKEKESTNCSEISSKKVTTSFNIKGVLLAIISGLFSACFNFGIEAGSEIANNAEHIWQSTNHVNSNFLFKNNLSFVLILLGGLITNLIACSILGFINNSYADLFKYKESGLRNLALCILGGTLWYLQFFFYGMGESKMGNGASSWILHMSFIILIANVWGVIEKEWKNVSKKTITITYTGIIFIFLSIILVGIGNSLK